MEDGPGGEAPEGEGGEADAAVQPEDEGDLDDEGDGVDDELGVALAEGEHGEDEEDGRDGVEEGAGQCGARDADHGARVPGAVGACPDGGTLGVSGLAGRGLALLALCFFCEPADIVDGGVHLVLGLLLCGGLRAEEEDDEADDEGEGDGGCEPPPPLRGGPSEGDDDGGAGGADGLEGAVPEGCWGWLVLDGFDAGEGFVEACLSLGAEGLFVLGQALLRVAFVWHGVIVGGRVAWEWCRALGWLQ